MNKQFLPLLFGGDINVYSVARAFHEAYGIIATAYGKYPSFPCAHSGIIDYHPTVGIDTPAVFLDVVTSVCAAHEDKTVLVIGCGDSYIQLAADLKGEFPANAIAPYIEGELMRQLTDKEQFYALCDKHGIPHPKTFTYRGEMGHHFTVPFAPPYIVKPANSISYWAHRYSGTEKVFLCHSDARLVEILDGVYGAGYPDAMIIQEYIPGDDSQNHVFINYSNGAGQVKMMCFGHILLQEHSPIGKGNDSATLTDYNAPLAETFRQLLDDIGYIGFSDIDMKYDARDGQFKAFEINCRQGRSNYFVTAAGQNLAKLLVEDRIFGAKQPFVLVEKKAFWTMLPRWVAIHFAAPQFRPAIKRCIADGAASNSLIYRGDWSLKRRMLVLKNQLGEVKRSFKYNPKSGQDAGL